MRSPRPAWLPLLALAASLAVPSAADASCVAPPPKVIWSDPADGATVPPNAVFWAIVPLGSRLSARLDGGALGGSQPASNASRFEPGPLTPGEHQLELIVEGDGPAVLVPVRFNVGSEPAEPATGSVVIDDHALHPLADPALPRMCDEVVQSFDCFDTGQDAQLELETSSRPMAWMVSDNSDPGRPKPPVLWPGECGPPRMVVHSEHAGCYAAFALDETGTARAANEVCTDGCGCSSGSGALLLPAWLLVLGIRRRARRAPAR